jgi:hypothetical protein
MIVALHGVKLMATVKQLCGIKTPLDGALRRDGRRRPIKMFI